jgi:HD-like signal output (HDOD) protein
MNANVKHASMVVVRILQALILQLFIAARTHKKIFAFIRVHWRTEIGMSEVIYEQYNDSAQRTEAGS